VRAAQHSHQLALWRDGSVAVNYAGASGSNPSLYYIFWFIFHKLFTRLGIRLGLGLVFLGLGIVLVYLAYDAIVLSARDI